MAKRYIIEETGEVRKLTYGEYGITGNINAIIEIYHCRKRETMIEYKVVKFTEEEV